MMKLKAFDIKDTDGFNEFTEKFPPRSTDKQSGVIFHNNTVVVVFDDGRANPAEKMVLLRTQLEAERQKRTLTQIDLGTAEIALSNIVPKGYKSGMSNGEIKKLVAEQAGGIDYAAEKSVVAQIENLENTIIMDKHEERRLGWRVIAMEGFLKAEEERIAESSK